jgi:hypothetical protein
MKASFQADLEKAKQAQETAQGAMTAAVNLLFTFYSNLLSPKSKYAWNKIVVEQTEGDLYVNLQGVSLEGPRGTSCESFNNCIMFHLLTVFPINAAEQEKYYILNVLKKPQHVSVLTLCRAAQCLHPPDAVLLLQPQCECQHQAREGSVTEAELGSHVLHMCPLQWQAQYNMNKKGMMPMDMRLLLTSLGAIKRVCTYEKGKSESSEKSSHKSKKGKNALVLRSIATCARSMGVRIPRTTLVIVIGLRKTERRNLISAPLRKLVRKVIP